MSVGRVVEHGLLIDVVGVALRRLGPGVYLVEERPGFGMQVTSGRVLAQRPGVVRGKWAQRRVGDSVLTLPQVLDELVRQPLLLVDRQRLAGRGATGPAADTSGPLSS